MTINKLSYTSSEVRRLTLGNKVHIARSILENWYRIGDAIWARSKRKAGTL